MGVADLYLGSASGIGATPDLTLSGGFSNLGHGSTVAGLGDVDGDGYDDVAISSPESAMYSSPAYTGEVALYLSSAIGLTSTAAVTITSVTESQYFGMDVAGAGDVNGDGYADLLIGARGSLFVKGEVDLYEGYPDPTRDLDGDGVPLASDCDDADAHVYPGASETCDGVDDNCDGVVDEDSAVDAGTWYADADGDGFGDPDRPQTACTEPSGAVADSTDCDDTQASVNPGATDVPGDGLDQDCDGADAAPVDTGSGYTGDSGDSDDSADSGDSGNSADSGDSGDGADSDNSGDSADSGDSVDSGDSGDSADSGDIADSGDGGAGGEEGEDTDDRGGSGAKLHSGCATVPAPARLTPVLLLSLAMALRRRRRT